MQPSSSKDRSVNEDIEEQNRKGDVVVTGEVGQNSAVRGLETESSSGAEQVEHQQEEEAFGGPETKVVFWLRWVLLAILIVSAVGVALAVYFYTSDAEKDEFEAHYEDDADKVIEAISSSLYLSLGALDAYVVNLVSFARYSNSSWPFVTIPDFAVRAAKVRKQAKAFIVNTYISVTEEQRSDWEAYSIANDGWVRQGMEVQKRDKNYFGIMMTEYEPYSTIYGNDGDIEIAQGAYGYLPTWQTYPVVPIWPPYNWDGASYSPMAAALPEVIDRARVVLRISNLPDPGDSVAVSHAEISNEWAKDYIGPDEDSSEPFLEVYYPILLEARDTVSISQLVKTTVVGILTPIIYWRELIKNILPPGHGGVVAVFQLGEHQVFTYEINGPDVLYLGQGDLHDKRFDGLKHSAGVLDLVSFSADYTGLPLSEEMKDYIISVYPSATMENEFTSSDPILFTVCVVVIFAFTSSIFLLYDRFVEKRQLRSTENVSLLESMVKERTHKLEEANRKVVQAAAAQLQHFACMSHEIRTPLNCIVGLSSFLEETQLDPVQTDSIQMIAASGDLLRAIVDDVLDYSKLESGNVDIEIKRSNFDQTLSSVVHAVDMRGRSNGVSVRTWYDPCIPEFVSTDVKRIQQILYNLLGNAVKFSREGDKVDLRVQICSPDRDRGNDSYSPELEGNSLDVVAPKKVLRFTVKNFGEGIKREDFPRIFKPFLQSGEETEIKYGGTGLGLAITSKLVHRLKGSISVESQEGEWAKFTVEFPYEDDTVDAETIASRLKMTTVLLISSDAVKREHMKSIFDYFGIVCNVFADMKELEAKIYLDSGDGKCIRTDRSYICLVSEDLHDQTIYNLLESRVQSVRLLAFGPSFSVPQAHRHFRSITKILPSVLIARLSDYASPSEHQQDTRRTRSSSINDDIDASYRKYHFMIAEDNVVNQKVLSRILSRLGIENVEVVDNGLKAVEREREVPFDVIFMDMQMPIMDGIEACRLINERKGGHPKAKIVFVTAHVQDSFKAECLEAGAIGYLAKPCTIKNVEECLQSIDK